MLPARFERIVSRADPADFEGIVVQQPPFHVFADRMAGIACESGAACARRANDGEKVGAWRCLESAATLPTQSMAFAGALSDSMLASDRIEIFSHSDRWCAAALLPLCRGEGYFARWRMLGAREVFEPNDVICCDSGAVEGLARSIAMQPRPLSLDRVPASSPLVPALLQAMRGRGIVSLRPDVPYPVIELDEGWREPDARFNSRRRSDFRRAMRRARAFGDVTFEAYSPEQELFDAVFDEAIHVEMSSWKNEAGTAIGKDRQKEEFFRSFFRLANAQGMFRVAFMRIDGRAVAMQMAVEFQRKYWLFKIGFDEEFQRCSPGTLLMLHTLGDAAQRGLEAYEFLGHCEQWIADFWTKQQHDCLRIRTYPFNFRGLAAIAADGAAWLLHRIAGRAE